MDNQLVINDAFLSVSIWLFYKTIILWKCYKVLLDSIKLVRSKGCQKFTYQSKVSRSIFIIILIEAAIDNIWEHWHMEPFLEYSLPLGIWAYHRTSELLSVIKLPMKYIICLMNFRNIDVFTFLRLVSEQSRLKLYWEWFYLTGCYYWVVQRTHLL